MYKKLIKHLTKLFLLLVITFNMQSCSKEGHIVITLPDTHLEETPAGFWLRMFEVDYSPGAENLKKQVLDKLRSDGTLIDEYIHKEGSKKVKTYVWKYRGYRIREEYYNGGWDSWITIEFSEGIPYSKLLPNHYEKIKPNRNYEHTATIKSTIDQERRLFLFGYGSRCQRISLF